MTHLESTCDWDKASPTPTKFCLDKTVIDTFKIPSWRRSPKKLGSSCQRHPKNCLTNYTWRERWTTSLTGTRSPLTPTSTEMMGSKWPMTREWSQSRSKWRFSYKRNLRMKLSPILILETPWRSRWQRTSCRARTTKQTLRQLFTLKTMKNFESAHQL